MIPTGALILFEKQPGFDLKNWASFFIRLVCGNKITHVGVVQQCSADGDIKYWDLNPGGSKLRVLSSYMTITDRGLIATKIAIPKILPITSVYDLSGWMLKNWKQKYANRRLFQLLILKGIRHFLDDDYTREEPWGGFGPGQTCSEWAANFLRSLGISQPYPAWQIDPDDFLDPDRFTVYELGAVR